MMTFHTEQIQRKSGEFCRILQINELPLFCPFFFFLSSIVEYCRTNKARESLSEARFSHEFQCLFTNAGLSRKGAA